MLWPLMVTSSRHVCGAEHARQALARLLVHTKLCTVSARKQTHASYPVAVTRSSWLYRAGTGFAFPSCYFPVNVLYNHRSMMQAG
jgi:hypothetical protein